MNSKYLGSRSARLARAHRRRASRGAVLVEALVVVVFFVLAFTGVLYFHTLYQRTLHTMRYARAATLGYAMVGCRGDRAAGLSRDLGNEHRADSNVGSASVPYGNSAAPSSSPEALRAVGASSNVTSGVGNPIVRFSVSREVSQRGAALDGEVTSASYEACADEVRDGTLGEVSGASSAVSF